VNQFTGALRELHNQHLVFSLPAALAALSAHVCRRITAIM
jgi:hypothetical protein